MSRNLATACVAMSSGACADWGAAAALQAIHGHAGPAVLFASLAAAQIVWTAAITWTAA